MTLQAALEARRPLPWVYELAADLESEPIADLARDAGVAARSLSGAADLFDLPAVCVTFDTTLSAEAVGCEVTEPATGANPAGAVEGIVETVDDAFEVEIDAVATGGRVPVMLDATERLTDTCDAAVLGGVTGPALLAEHLLADPDGADGAVREEAAFTAGEIAVELANAYLDAGADGVALLEPAGLDAPLYREAAEPIANVLDHYEAEGVVVTGRASDADVRTAGAVGFDAVTGAVDDVDGALAAAEEAGIALCLGVPRDAFADGPEGVAAFRENAPAGTPLSSEWTVPTGTAPEAVHELMGSR